jgi:hypothetical protein
MWWRIQAWLLNNTHLLQAHLSIQTTARALRSMALKWRASSSRSSVYTSPAAPARAVRPARCTYLQKSESRSDQRAGQADVGDRRAPDALVGERVGWRERLATGVCGRDGSVRRNTQDDCGAVRQRGRLGRAN